jgi:hypothetical protein
MKENEKLAKGLERNKHEIVKRQVYHGALDGLIVMSRVEVQES